MRKSTARDIKQAYTLVHRTVSEIENLIIHKKVHIIWDFDCVLSDPRDTDVSSFLNDIKRYFDYEERLLFQIPSEGPWLSLATRWDLWSVCKHTTKNLTFDIVTARSSFLAYRVYTFCSFWSLPVRWVFFIGHQDKSESYRLIIKSHKDDADCHIFCIDDNAKHVADFQRVSAEEGIQDRAHGIVSPVIRKYGKKDLERYCKNVLSVDGYTPVRVPDICDPTRTLVVVPDGSRRFMEQMKKGIRSVRADAV